jgi:hypothetical protein
LPAATPTKAKDEQSSKNVGLKVQTDIWKTFALEQVTPKVAARLYKIIQRKAYNKLGLLRRADDTLTESTEESHRLLMAKHFPGSSNIPEIMDTAGTTPDPLGAT